MTVNTKRLRELAGHADAVGGDWLAIFRGAANPQTVIALLDEIDAHRRTLDEKLGAWQVSKELGDARWEARRLTEQLAAVTAERDEAFAKVDSLYAAREAKDPNHKLVEFHNKTVDDLKAQLAAMTAARDEACDVAEMLSNQVTKFPATGGPTAADKRIAELRKVGRDE